MAISDEEPGRTVASYKPTPGPFEINRMEYPQGHCIGYEVSSQSDPIARLVSCWVPRRCNISTAKAIKEAEANAVSFVYGIEALSFVEKIRCILETIKIPAIAISEIRRAIAIYCEKQASAEYTLRDLLARERELSKAEG